MPDTNVLVSGSIVPYGNPAFILDSWRNGKIQIITSLEILEEFKRAMLEYLHVPKDEVEVLNAFFIWKGKVVEPKQKFDVIKEDPNDNKFLEVAVEEKADYIVSGDKDLLRLGSFMGIKIISPAEMVNILKKL
ncbi:MAG: putative toxin-antitoxin system toxin component, PIN family [Candidatus Aenigmarchaeota archaeon]|nr:putative toxin-antitoxin system toxin component, PIN family [Candidatus Aenigmarchaeota archaeon]